MPQTSGFDAELDAVNAAGALAPEEALPLLRKALAHRSNLIVSRAAKHAGRLNLTVLTEALAEAFHRFMPPAGDPAKTDPQCWAKNEIAKTLAAFGYQESELFLAGMKHLQMEPTWGGPSDTAGPLRGTCALARVQCHEVAPSILLRDLAPLFRDKELPVQVNAARAVEQVGSDAAALRTTRKPSPEGAAPSQPRVKPWVTTPNKRHSPERASYRCQHRIERPFRAYLLHAP